MAELTTAQLATFKADIIANTNQAVIDALAAGAHNAIAAWYNGTASPDFYMFRTLVSPDEVGMVIELDDVANMTTGDVEKLNSFFRLRPGGFSGNSLSDRAGFDDVLSSAAADDSQQAIIALWKRLATEAEKLFSTGAGVGTIGDPADSVLDGSVSSGDITAALNS